MDKTLYVQWAFRRKTPNSQPYLLSKRPQQTEKGTTLAHAHGLVIIWSMNPEPPKVFTWTPFIHKQEGPPALCFINTPPDQPTPLNSLSTVEEPESMTTDTWFKVVQRPANSALQDVEKFKVEFSKCQPPKQNGKWWSGYFPLTKEIGHIICERKCPENISLKCL